MVYDLPIEPLQLLEVLQHSFRFRENLGIPTTDVTTVKLESCIDKVVELMPGISVTEVY